MLRNRRVLLNAVVTVLILVWFLSTVNFDFQTILARLRAAELSQVILAVIVYYAALVVRAMRWQLQLHHAGFEQEGAAIYPPLWKLFLIFYLSWFANCIVPGKLGDVYRGYVLKHEARLSVSRTLGTVWGEHLADGLIVSSFVIISGLISYRVFPGVVQSYFGIAIGIFVAIVIGSALFLRPASGTRLRWVPIRYQSSLQGLRDGMVSTFKPGIGAKLYALSSIIWLCDIARFWLVLNSVSDSALQPAIIAFTAMVSALMVAVPITPAGLGAVEGTAVVLLTAFGVERGTAGSVIILDRLITYWGTIAVGTMLYLVWWKRKTLIKGRTATSSVRS